MATIKGVSNLVFGVDVVSGVIMISEDSDLTGMVTEVPSEVNEVVGFAISHTTRTDISGTYTFIGADITTAISTAITLTNSVGSGGIYVYSYGRRQANNRFLTGNFKALRVTGIS